jgi:hypothetical protein
VTVAELIEKLSQLDGELEVFVWDPFSDATDDLYRLDNDDPTVIRGDWLFLRLGERLIEEEL